MILLGLADNHDAGAALVVDGKLVAACGQERIDRIKTSGAFPWGAIDAVLDRAGVRYRDVDRVAVGTGFTPSWFLRRFPDLHHKRKAHGDQFDPALNAYVAYQVGLRRTGLYVQEVEACRRLLERRLMDRGFAKATVEMWDHHAAHAEAAYRTQPNLDCLVLTVDAMGDGISNTAWLGRAGDLERHYAQSGFSAVNTYYSRVTQVLGFTPNRHEGKITGLAAYVDPPSELLEHFRGQLRFTGRGFSRVNYLRPHSADDAFYGPLARYSREQVAAACQAILEEAVTDYVRHWVQTTGQSTVAVCGGIFANVKLNQRIAELECVDQLTVFPNMGDGGLCAGAALASAGVPPHELESVYLGPTYSELDMSRALGVANLRPKRVTPDDVAELLAQGKVVASFDGGMEFGPRALGNRSLLVRPDDPAVNQWLNERLERSEFMPFAPMVRQEDAADLFIGWDKARQASRFMTVCFDVVPERVEAIRGCVHVDGTARPQVVRQQDNPRCHAVLTAFQQKTGLPALINTSFNMHEEPIVCSPGDAIRAWQRGHLDALWMGPFLVTQ